MKAIEVPAPVGWEDALTGLGGPELWRRTLVGEVARSTRYGSPMCVVVIEVHGLEQLGASFGPDQCRRALRETAEAILRASRGSDTCTRIGPSRFGVVLVETDEVAAVNFVERVREELPRTLAPHADGLRFGFGWASPRDGESAHALARRAATRLMVELLG